MLRSSIKLFCFFSLALFVCCSKANNKQQKTTQKSPFYFEFDKHKDKFKYLKPTILSLDTLYSEIKSNSLKEIDSTVFKTFLQNDTLISLEEISNKHYYYSIYDTSNDVVSVIIGSVLFGYLPEFVIFSFTKEGKLIDQATLLMDYVDGGSSCKSKGIFLNDSVFYAIWIKSHNNMLGDTIFVDSSNINFIFHSNGLIEEQRETFNYLYRTK